MFSRARHAEVKQLALLKFVARIIWILLDQPYGFRFAFAN